MPKYRDLPYWTCVACGPSSASEKEGICISCLKPLTRVESFNLPAAQASRNIDISADFDDDTTPTIDATRQELEDQVRDLQTQVSWLSRERERLQEELYDFKKRNPRWWKMLYGRPQDLSVTLRTGDEKNVKVYSWWSEGRKLYENVCVVKGLEDEREFDELQRALRQRFPNMLLIHLQPHEDFAIAEMVR